ncbi:ABC transporter permease [Tsukamurella soli]|uniref:ABC transporter permease n=1 Tax=Tsukamurella soli TaxID=644556 RepID=UPI0031E8F91B
MFTVVGCAIALCLISPLLAVVLDAQHAGWHEVRTVLFRARSYSLLADTVALSATVAVGAAVIGTAAALAIERSGVPLRRLWSVLLVLPMAMPDFVVGFSWHSLLPTMNPLLAATAIMVLSTYPLVFLPVSAALRRSDSALEEVARGLGLGPVATFARVTIPAVRGAVAGGTLLAVLTVISEYGAFEAVRYHTLTTEIFTEFQFDPAAAAALSVPLLVLGLLFIGLDMAIPRRQAALQVGSRTEVRGRSRWRAVPVTVLFTVLVGLGVAAPVGVLVYWMRQSQHTTLPAVATLSVATESTFGYCAMGGLGVVLLAVPVAVLAVRYPSRWSTAVSVGAYITRALPGVIVALSLVYLAINYLTPVYETPYLVVAAYVILFFPLGLVCVQATVAQLPPQLIEVAHSLGRGNLYVFARITLPLIGPGLIAGFCMVFVTATTELTTTLLLAPLGVETLATQFWAFQTESSYGAAAPYALVIVVVSVIPGALLGLWFDRGPRVHRAPSTEVGGPEGAREEVLSR